MSDMENQKKDFQYFVDHHDELVEKYNGKFVVIKNSTVLQAYDNVLDAVKETQKSGHDMGTFIVQKVSPGDEDYTVTVHSRMVTHA